MAIVKTNNMQVGVASGTLAVAGAAGNTGGGSGNAYINAFSSAPGTATFTFSSTGNIFGGLALRAQSAGAATDKLQAYWTITSGPGSTVSTPLDTTAFRVYFTVNALNAGTGYDLVQAINSAFAAGLRIIKTSAHQIIVQDTAGLLLKTFTPALTVGGEYYVQVSVTKGTTTTNGSCVVGVYNANTDVLIDPLYTSGATINTGTAQFIRWQLHGNTASQPTDVSWGPMAMANDGTFPGPYVPGANLPPIVTAPANQNLAPSATASVTFPESDDVGIVSRTTTFFYSSTAPPTITNPGSQTSTFPVGPAGSLYIVTRTVTDAGGLTDSAQMEVRVPHTAAGSELRPIPVTPAGTFVGTPTTSGTTLSDETDTTYLESPTVVATEATMKIRLQPSATRTNGTVTFRLAKTDAGAVVTTCSLYQYTTLIESWTVTVTTTPTTFSHAITSGGIAAITDWGGLYVQVGVRT